MKVPLVAIFTVLCVELCSSQAPFGQKHKATKGSIWPRPRHQVTEYSYYKFTYSYYRFNISMPGHVCTTLFRAGLRYGLTLRNMHKNAVRIYEKIPQQRETVEDGNYRGALQELQITLTAPCENYPHLDMDESYELTVSRVCVLRSASVWGILRGLESWVQLFYMTGEEPDLRINRTTISDAPHYAHRGLLIDTAQHYLTRASILTMLDAMAINKMNVLHWRIVDDQSFPYQSDKFPELSERGAYHSSLIYSRQDIIVIVNHARDRGIRVIPEFHVPGHTRSWGESHPDLLTQCYKNGLPSHLGPMNPVSNGTYQLLRDLFDEVRVWFPDVYIHIGGDYVDLKCWESNPELKKYLRTHKILAPKLYSIFMSNVIRLLPQKSKPIVWQEVFDEYVDLPNDTLIQVWKTNDVDYIAKEGYKVIYSTDWCSESKHPDWAQLYMTELRDLTSQAELAAAVVGGEICAWEGDDATVVAKAWPRAASVAEKLWSEPSSDDLQPGPGEETYSRLEEHTCRMKARGVAAQVPSGPGYCLIP